MAQEQPSVTPSWEAIQKYSLRRYGSEVLLVYWLLGEGQGVPCGISSSVPRAA